MAVGARGAHTHSLPFECGGEGKRRRVSRNVKEEETAGGDEGTAIPGAISLTHPRSWEQIAHLESFSWKKKKKASLKIYFLSHLILELEQPSWATTKKPSGGE